MSWYLPSFTYLSIQLIPISHYLQKLIVTRQITSYCFASSLSVHSEYLSFSLHHPALRTFVQHSPSTASIALHPVLRPASSLAFSIKFSVVSSLLTSCTMLASSCLISVSSPPSFPHSSSSFHIISTLSKVWDSSGLHHYSTVLNSHLYYILRLLKVCPCTFVVFRCFVVKSIWVHISVQQSKSIYLNWWLPQRHTQQVLDYYCPCLIHAEVNQSDDANIYFNWCQHTQIPDNCLFTGREINQMACNKAKVYLEDDCVEDMLNKSWPIIAQGLFMLKEGTTTPKPNSTMLPCVALYVSCLDKIG